MTSRIDRGLIVLCVSFIIITSGILLFRFFEMPFITQSVDDVERIVIVDSLNSQNRESAIYIYERNEIEHIYSLLNRTTGIRAHRWLKHPGIAADGPKFVIRLEYHDGEIDEFSGAIEAAGRVFRWLDIRWWYREQGFIIGTNRKLHEYIDKLLYNSSD